MAFCQLPQQTADNCPKLPWLKLLPTCRCHWWCFYGCRCHCSSGWDLWCDNRRRLHGRGLSGWRHSRGGCSCCTCCWVCCARCWCDPERDCVAAAAAAVTGDRQPGCVGAWGQLQRGSGTLVTAAAGSEEQHPQQSARVSQGAFSKPQALSKALTAPNLGRPRSLHSVQVSWQLKPPQLPRLCSRPAFPCPSCLSPHPHLSDLLVAVLPCEPPQVPPDAAPCLLTGPAAIQQHHRKTLGGGGRKHTASQGG